MQEFRKRNKIKKKIYSKFTIFVLFVIFLLLVHGSWKVFKTAQASKEKTEVAQAEYQKLQKRYESVSAQVSFLKTDAGLENEIRTKYNVSKNDEKIVIIVDEKEKEKVIEAKEKPGLLKKIKSWFEN